MTPRYPWILGLIPRGDKNFVLRVCKLFRFHITTFLSYPYQQNQLNLNININVVSTRNPISLLTLFWGKWDIGMQAGEPIYWQGDKSFCPNLATFNVPPSLTTPPLWFELSKREEKKGQSFETPCSNPVSVKWTRDQSQLKSFCILQPSGDPFKSAKSRPASVLSPIETRSKNLLENVCIF